MRILRLIILILSTSSSNSQNLGPGYQFDLFKNTDSWELAKAVENEDVNKIEKILNSQKIDINFQEPIYNNTILQLAVGNDKLLSTAILLKYNANFNIPNRYNTAAIHEASSFIPLKKNSYKILETLLKYGVNVNMLMASPNKTSDSIGYTIPLKLAINNLDCSKLLLNHGANAYFKTGNEYPIWFDMLIANYGENIYVAKYMIIDKSMKIPHPIAYDSEKKPIDIFTLLNALDFPNDTKRQLIKQEILDYLKKINFPENGVYK